MLLLALEDGKFKTAESLTKHRNMDVLDQSGPHYITRGERRGCAIINWILFQLVVIVVEVWIVLNWTVCQTSVYYFLLFSWPNNLFGLEREYLIWLFAFTIHKNRKYWPDQDNREEITSIKHEKQQQEKVHLWWEK